MSVGASLRVAAVGYLNARPLCEGLDREPWSARVRLDCATPAEVARRVAEDEADVALMPVAAAASIGDLRAVRGCAVAARGAVRSVVIVGDRPVEELEELSVDSSSRTSVVLARLVLRARVGREPRLLGASPREAVDGVRGKRGALVIGDPALEIEGRFPHVLDLGSAWKDCTGLPFVFAAWFGRPAALSAEDERILVEARRAGLERRDAIADAHAARTGLPAASLRSYLRDAVVFDLGDDERRGLERFYEEAAAAGLLPKASVRFFDEDRKRPVARPPVGALVTRAADGERLSAAEGERLLAEASLFELGLAADAVRRRKHPHGVVTYIVDRNVNYTNVCTTSCRFCAFYRPAGHPEGYVLSREELGKKLQEVVDAGGVQISCREACTPTCASSGTRTSSAG